MATELGAQEWRDSLFLIYRIDPPDLPGHCNEFGVSFFICHTLNFKKGGLITACYNKLCDGVTDVVIKAFTPTHAHEAPKINKGCVVQGGGGTQRVPFEEQGGAKWAFNCQRPLDVGDGQ